MAVAFIEGAEIPITQDTPEITRGLHIIDSVSAARVAIDVFESSLNVYLGENDWHQRAAATNSLVTQ